MVAASTSASRAPISETREFLSSLTEYVQRFSEGLGMSGIISTDDRRATTDSTTGVGAVAEKRNIEYIMKTFGYPKEDIMEWLDTVAYPKDIGLVDLSVVVHTLE